MTAVGEGRVGYHAKLDEVRADVVHLAGLVVDAVPRATAALLDGDLVAAKALVDGDDELDDLTFGIEEACYQILALQNPVAGDLRAVVTALKVASEFERCGDLAVNLAKAARRLYGVDLPPRLRGMVERMSTTALRLLRVATDAYVDGDAARAAALDDLDDELDDLQRAWVAAIFEANRGDALDLPTGVQLALVGRFYERLGDHAVNVAERVQYLVTGALPERGVVPP